MEALGVKPCDLLRYPNEREEISLVIFTVRDVI
jgi:hypothetical protein